MSHNNPPPFRARRRFRDAAPHEIDALTLEGMRSAVEAQLYAGNLEARVAMRVCACVRRVCAV